MDIPHLEEDIERTDYTWKMTQRGPTTPGREHEMDILHLEEDTERTDCTWKMTQKGPTTPGTGSK